MHENCRKQGSIQIFHTLTEIKKLNQRKHVTTRTVELLRLIICPLIANF